MTPINRTGILLVLLALSVLAVGCCDQEKKEIAYLTQQNLDLTKDAKEVREELAEARTRESQLLGQMDSKDLEITALRTENDDLKRRLAAGGTPPVPPERPGAETTVYTETVGSDVLFESGKATLTTAGKARLNETVALLKSKYTGLAVRVYGYTDSDPIKHSRKLWEDNLDLSANRAMAVTRYLRQQGLPAERVETVAMGATNPVTSNDTKAGKAQNRRVVIKVVRT